MKILAFDTSSTACSVAVLYNDEVRLYHKLASMKQAEWILPVIQSLLNDYAIKLTELDAIAFGQGPGSSFTGIRIASCVAQGLSYAAGLPVIAISSMAALAQTAYLENKWTNLLVAIDARMQKIYWAEYRVQEQAVSLLNKESMIDPMQIPPATCLRQGYYGIGDGWAKYRDKIINCLNIEPIAINEMLVPTAEAVAKLARVKLLNGEVLASYKALPSYLR